MAYANGASPGEGATVSIPTGASRTYTAAELKSGSAAGLERLIGDGSGKLRLVLESEQTTMSMSLMSSPAGHLTNLSMALDSEQDGTGCRAAVPIGAGRARPTGFERVVNRSNEAGEVAVAAFHATHQEYEVLMLAIGSGRACDAGQAVVE